MMSSNLQDEDRKRFDVTMDHVDWTPQMFRRDDRRSLNYVIDRDAIDSLRL